MAAQQYTNTVSPISSISRYLHWIIAFAIIGLLSTGLYMKRLEVYDLYPIHKSVGVIIAAFVITRIVWRIREGWPHPASKYSHFEHVMAKITHWILIIGTALMPTSGMMLSGASGHGFGIFSLTIVASNYGPDGQAIPYNEFVTNVGYGIHEYAGYAMIVAALLHIIGALKHHIIDKDRTLLRMLGR